MKRRGKAVPEGSGSGSRGPAETVVVQLPSEATFERGARPEGPAVAVTGTFRPVSGPGEQAERGGPDPQGGRACRLGGAVLGVAGGAAERMRRSGFGSVGTATL